MSEACVRDTRASNAIRFNDWVRALIEYAQADGANGCPPGASHQTKDAARWLRAAYRDALDEAASAARET